MYDVLPPQIWMPFEDLLGVIQFFCPMREWANGFEDVANEYLEVLVATFWPGRQSVVDHATDRGMFG